MKKLLPVCVLVLGLGVGRADAALLQIDATGLLTGATGVMVNGTAYDVRFEAGSCNAVFNGCDPLEDFLFTSGASALAASQALLDQVFLGENHGIADGDPNGPGWFDSHPGLTQGCTQAFFQVCIALTPYAFSSGTFLLTGNATNYGGYFDNVGDVATLGSMVGGGTPTAGNQTFAVWSLSPVTTTVPEAPTFALFCAGLIALVLPLGGRARRIAAVR